MIKNWKLEITENETKLIIQDGAAMNNDILRSEERRVGKECRL